MGNKIKALFRKENLRKTLGALLMIAGCALILSVFVVPAVNARRNKALVEAVKEKKPAVTSSAAAELSSAAVNASAAAVQTKDPETEAAARRAALLRENGCIGIVIIDKINVELAIAEGTADETLKKFVGHLSESAGLGQAGNCVISAHHGGYYGEFFANLEQLEAGDVIQMMDANGSTYRYAVYEKKIVNRTDWSVIKNLNDKSTLTLITCVDSTQEERIVVSAILF